jgi:Secretion system C-terminal sorting domain
MKVEDGWELIRRDFGYTDLNILKPEVPEHTYFILYNKYTGVLRVLLKTCRGADYNGMKISIKFDATTIFQTALLDLTTSTRALDSTHLKNPVGQSAAVFVNDRTKWFYGDFPMNYDACACKYKSKLNIISQLIQNSVINLEGSINGTITTIANGQGSVNSSGAFSFKDFVNGADKFKKGYASVDNFITETKTVASTIPNSAAVTNALTSLQTGLKDNQFLKTGLAAVPWLKTAAGLLDFFSGGGSTNPQTVQLMPMAVNLSVRLNGTMKTSNQYHNIIFTNPGSLDAQNDPDIYPFYNEVLGVFNLLNTPTFRYTFKRVRTGSPRDGFTYEDKLTYQMKSPVKWVLNPSAGLTLQDGQVAFVTLSGNSATPPSSIGEGYDFLEGKDAETGLWQYRTEYVPMSCLSNNFSFEFDRYQPPFFMKFILNFKRVNNPAAQNVLLITKFPVKIEGTTDVLTTLEFNPTSCLGGYLSQATSTEINTFCNSTTYTNNRENRVALASQNDSLIRKESITIYPNPVSNTLNINGVTNNDRIKNIVIFDIVGKKRLEISSDILGPFFKSIDVGKLSNGTYLIKLSYSSGKSTSQKFIIAR